MALRKKLWEEIEIRSESKFAYLKRWSDAN